MDAETVNILEEWKLNAYIDDFKEHEVDLDSLLILSEDAIRILLKGKIGAVSRFIRNRSSFLAKRNAAMLPLHEQHIQESCKDACLCFKQVKLIKEENHPLEEELSPEISKEEFDLELHNWTKVENFPQQPNNRIVEKAEEIISNGEHCYVTTLEADSSASTSCSSGVSTSHQSLREPLMAAATTVEENVLDQQWGNRSEKRSWGGESAESPPKKKSSISVEENVVKRYLSETCIGTALLSSWKKGLPLDQARRLKLCHEVVCAEMKPDGERFISKDRFEFLTDCILELFPREKRSTYYIPRKPAKGQMPSVTPKGILYDKYHNLLRFLRESGVRSSIRADNTAVAVDTEVIGELNIKPSVLKDIEWLESMSAGSQSETKGKWLTTAEYRIAALRNSQDRVSQTKLNIQKVDPYVQRFSCLSQEWGSSLLLSDFEHLYGGKYNSLLENWTQIAPRIIALAKKKSSYVQPSDMVQCLRLIPSLFNQPTIAPANRRNKNVWKPNAAESREGFLLHVKVIDDLEVVINDLKIKCEKVQKTLQPLPVVVGLTEDSITASYVVVGNIRYRMDSPLTAMDSCFKMYHALHTFYPYQASYAWQFLQQAVYGIFTEWDIDAPAVIVKLSEYQVPSTC